MRICVTCKKEKELREFPRSKYYDHRCSDCIHEYNTSDIRRRKNRESVRKSSEKRRDIVRQYKQERPCKDCGNYYPYYVMDFDHLGNKSFMIGPSKTSVTLERLWEEIAKCEVVCANCHRIRTFKRK